MQVCFGLSTTSTSTFSVVSYSFNYKFLLSYGVFLKSFASSIFFAVRDFDQWKTGEICPINHYSCLCAYAVVILCSNTVPPQDKVSSSQYLVIRYPFYLYYIKIPNLFILVFFTHCVNYLQAESYSYLATIISQLCLKFTKSHQKSILSLNSFILYLIISTIIRLLFTDS